MRSVPSATSRPIAPIGINEDERRAVPENRRDLGAEIRVALAADQPQSAVGRPCAGRATGCPACPWPRSPSRESPGIRCPRCRSRGPPDRRETESLPRSTARDSPRCVAGPCGRHASRWHPWPASAGRRCRRTGCPSMGHAGQVLEHQVGRAERAGGEDQPIGRHRLDGERRGPRCAPSRPRSCRTTSTVQPPSCGAKVRTSVRVWISAPRRCRRQVVVVERVLGPEVAADVAFAEQPAGLARAAVQVRVLLDGSARRGPGLALVREGDGEVRGERLPAEPLAGRDEGDASSGVSYGG